MNDPGVSWETILLEGSAAVVAGMFVLVSVVVGARIYREGVRDRRPDMTDRDDPTPPDTPA